MKVDWRALLNVTVVTLVVAVAAVAVVSAAAYCLDTAHERELQGRPVPALRIAGFALFVVVGMGVLFGLWLMIPYFH